MDYLNEYEKWLNSPEVAKNDKAYLSAMNDKEIKEAFYTSLAFGTAGMRGVLSPGTNRMNVFTVRRATKGLADYVNSLGEDAKKRGIVISYDTRRFSPEFAIEAAKVLSANGVNVYLFENVRPVPICSFAIRELNAAGGVMITASHNPKIYNGYKLYGDDGAQMSPEATDTVVNFISKTPYFGIEEADIEITAQSIKDLNGKKLDNFITVVGKDVDEKYFQAIEKLSLSFDAVKKYGAKVKIVYTPIHGSGFMPVTTILKRMGINFNVVKEQAEPDPDFSTVRVPNPEEADTLKLGVELAKKIGSDVVIGTDPDSDRMGVAIRNEKSEFVLLNGNQIGVLLANYIMLRKSQTGTLPKNGALVKTIVSTEMARFIAADYGVETFDVLTGFKFIGEKIKEWEANGKYTYLFGFEESYGSLAGTHARDKDAVVAAMLFAEMVCYFESINKTVYGVLQELYNIYGYFVEKSVSVTFGGIDGMEKMAAIMKKLFNTRFEQVAGVKVLSSNDYRKGITTLLPSGETQPTGLPLTNALKFKLEGGDWICVRPSGTEPKLKFYVATSKPDLDSANKTAESYLNFMKKNSE